MTYEINICNRGTEIIDKKTYYQFITNIVDYGMIIVNRIENSSICHIDIDWNPHESFYVPQNFLKK